MQGMNSKSVQNTLIIQLPYEPLLNSFLRIFTMGVRNLKKLVLFCLSFFLERVNQVLKNQLDPMFYLR